MGALIKRDFVRLSYKKKASRNPERFYKITRNGLKALLSVDKLSPQEFWKAAVLLCITSEGNNYESQFLDYYNHYENDFIGVSARRHLLPSWFFDDILRLWLDTNDVRLPTGSFNPAPLPQLIIESLALNGPMGLRGLADNTSAKEEDMIRVLNSYSIKSGDILKFNLQSNDRTEIRKRIYEDFTSRLLIYARGNGTETTYELTIFGVILAIALIRYCQTRMHTALPVNSSTYDKKTQQNYNKIALNYGKKLPLIFGRWSLLRSHLGSLLYNSFDFLFFEIAKSNISDTSVWSGGNK
jgi:hypothetical protein